MSRSETFTEGDIICMALDRCENIIGLFVDEDGDLCYEIMSVAPEQIEAALAEMGYSLVKLAK